MAKSARSSAVKKNRQNLKKKVFGPVETARNERLSAKLEELAAQPAPPRREMELEQDESKESEPKNKAAEDVDMDAADSKRTPRSTSALKKQKAAKSARIEKKRVRKERNKIVFPKHAKKGKKGSKS